MARKPFVVIDAEILSSSIWSEASHTKLVWLTLLILCDTDGYVGASLPGIAHAAGVTREECEEALGILQQPDPDSRTQSNDGRRLQRVERGWVVLNFREHLDRLSKERAKSRDRVRKHRARRNASNATKADMSADVTTGNREQGIGNREQRTDLVERPVVANPLVADKRDEIIREGYELVGTIAQLENLDGTEVLSKASAWKGRGRVDLASMYDNRLAHTMNNLRAWHRKVTGKAEPQMPVTETPSPRAEARRAGMEAMIRGGLKSDGRSVDDGTGGTRGGLPGGG